MPCKHNLFIVLLVAVFIIPFVSAAWTSNLNDQLISYWNMDNGTDSKVINQINGSANGTLMNGANWTLGILGNGTTYNNSKSTYMTTPFYIPSGTTSKSVSLWFQVYANTADGQNIFSGGAQSVAAFYSLHYDYSFPTHDLYFFGWATPSFQVLGPGVLTLNTWHHAVVIYNNTNSNTTVYIDGVSHSHVSALNTGSTDVFQIGRYGTTAYLNGAVDEVGVWSRVLTDAEAAQLYNSGTGITYPIGGPSDSTYPTFSLYNVTPVNNTAYSLGAIYRFNVTVSNTNGTSGIDFNGINYSSSNLSSVFNASITTLGAGTYSYYWWSYGNGTSFNYNVSNIQYYSISQATPTITKMLNGVDNNVSGYDPLQVNASGSTSGGSIIVYRNGINITNGANYNLTVGVYQFDFNVTGNQNYTNLSRTLYATVTVAPTSTTVSAQLCRYKKFGYYNINLPALRQTGCI